MARRLVVPGDTRERRGRCRMHVGVVGGKRRQLNMLLDRREARLGILAQVMRVNHRHMRALPVAQRRVGLARRGVLGFPACLILFKRSVVKERSAVRRRVLSGEVLRAEAKSLRKRSSSSTFVNSLHALEVCEAVDRLRLSFLAISGGVEATSFSACGVVARDRSVAVGALAVNGHAVPLALPE